MISVTVSLFNEPYLSGVALKLKYKNCLHLKEKLISCQLKTIGSHPCSIFMTYVTFKKSRIWLVQLKKSDGPYFFCTCRHHHRTRISLFSSVIVQQRSVLSSVRSEKQIWEYGPARGKKGKEAVVRKSTIMNRIRSGWDLAPEMARPRRASIHHRPIQPPLLFFRVSDCRWKKNTGRLVSQAWAVLTYNFTVIIT